MATLPDSVPEKLAETKGTGEATASGRPQASEPPAESSSGPSSLAPESLSSASSFQSLASSLSSKSSSGICADSAPGSPDKPAGFDHSYINVDIPDLDDLISACANINLNSAAAAAADRASSPDSSGADLSQNQTFASASDDTITDKTEINLCVDESIQTFKTCPNLEGTQVTKVISTSVLFKAPQPVSEVSSVVPYVSFEESVLSKQQEVEQRIDEFADTAVFKSALSSPPRFCGSPTPCEEIDTAKLVINYPSEQHPDHNAGTLHDQAKDRNEVALNTPDVSFEEARTFNSTITVVSNDSTQKESISTSKSSEKLNLTATRTTEVFVSSPLVTTNFNQEEDNLGNQVSNTNEPVCQNSSNIPADYCKTEAVVEQRIVTETEVIVQGGKSIAESEDVIQEINIVNDVLNKTQEIQVESNLNQTVDIIQETNPLSETAEIQIKHNLNETVDIIPESNNLNITQDIVHAEQSLNKSEDNLVDEATTSNKNNSIVQNESQGLNKVNVLTEKEAGTSKLSSELITEKAGSVEEVSETVASQIDTEREFEKIPVSVQEPQTPNKSEVILKNEVESPSKVFEKEIQAQYQSLHQSLAFVIEDSQNSNLLPTDIIASTPLPTKCSGKEDKPRSPKRKSALFVKEFKSPKPKSPQAVPQDSNIPSKNEVDTEVNNKFEFDQTLAVSQTFERSSFDASELITKDNLEATNILQASLNPSTPQEPDYEAFKPQQQSTNLPFPHRNYSEVIQEAALSVAKDIETSLENFEDNEHFVSATTELFGDPSALEFLNQLGSQTSKRTERYDSLYMKFDPLAQRLTMLPQKNLPASPLVDEEEEKEDKVDTPISNMGTPKKNPALAAIDRLLFYSPGTPSSTESHVAEAKQKREEAEKPQPPSTPVVDKNMAKELELVRSTVLKLEADLEKQKLEHKEQLEKQKAIYEDKISKMQSQLSQEVKCKDQMTVVVEEYEKSISRLIAEREKERTSFQVEKAKFQEDLQVANQHLNNAETAFSDVHSKYERLKNVVSVYKSNEAVLKESIAENQETIKSLDNKYEQLKSHAMAQLEKANLELNAIRKHNEAETAKLKALVRKAELKSKSLEETVEQKTKENKELTQIIDEIIARVD